MNTGAFRIGQVRDAPAGIALAAGSHHITNFDADSARPAAPPELYRESVLEAQMLLKAAKQSGKPFIPLVPVVASVNRLELESKVPCRK